MTRFAAGESQWTNRLGNLRNLIRQELIARQVSPEIESGMEVLDVGCGQGTQTLLIAAAGCRVTGVDPSQDLLQRCSEQADAKGLSMELLNGTIDDLDRLLGDRKFDFVCCHGVFMYLDERREPLRILSTHLSKNGRLSVTFRNAHALAMRPGLRHEWSNALAAFDTREYLNELGVMATADRLEDIEKYLMSADLRLVTWYGVRVFNDAISADAQAPDVEELELLLDAEERACSTDPYRKMASQLHVIAAHVLSFSIPSDVDAVKINEILKDKYYDSDGETWWWNTPNSHLLGKTPHQVWLNENKQSMTMIELVRNAAIAANVMGHAT